MNEPGGAPFKNSRLRYESALFLIILILLPGIHLFGQSNEDSINRKRLNTVIIGSSAAYAGSLVVLYYAWYKDAPKTTFHFIDDSRYWLQIDKVGHATTAYTLSNYSFSCYWVFTLFFIVFPIESCASLLPNR